MPPLVNSSCHSHSCGHESQTTTSVEYICDDALMMAGGWLTFWNDDHDMVSSKTLSNSFECRQVGIVTNALIFPRQQQVQDHGVHDEWKMKRMRCGMMVTNGNNSPSRWTCSS